MTWAINYLTRKHEDLSLISRTEAEHGCTCSNPNGQMAWVTQRVSSQWALFQKTRRTVPKEWHLCPISGLHMCVPTHAHRKTRVHTHRERHTNLAKQHLWHTVQKNVYSDQYIVTKMLELLKSFLQVFGSFFLGLRAHVCKREVKKRIPKPS